MVEHSSYREAVGFDPQKMGQLETSHYKKLIERDMTGAFQATLEMYKEQWKLADHVAAAAIHFIESSRVFIDGEGKDKMAMTGHLLVYSHYSLIARDSGLKFDPELVTEAYIEATKQSSDENPIPLRAVARLFGLIYSINPDDETLVDAMDLRSAAFFMLGKEGFGSDEDLSEFEGYLTDYYHYLDMARKHDE